jgi:cell division protein FtsI/penicillin-binding protein 2
MMRNFLTKSLACTAACSFLFLACVMARGQASSAASKMLHQSLQTTPAVAVVLDVETGRMMATVRPKDATNLRSAPGSVLKPFFLADALANQRIQPQSTVFCNRLLVISGRNVPCTHPQTEASFDAEQALAYSCNRYFADLAKRFSPEQAVNALRRYGLGELQSPATTEQTELFVLGLEGIRISPAQLAVAYRRLALQLKHIPTGSPLSVVKQGLEDSVQYGMAHNGQVADLPIAGKTGTASDPGQRWTHGWFAGFAPADSPQVVVVVYLPQGNGADAAHLAQSFLDADKDSLLR